MKKLTALILIAILVSSSAFAGSIDEFFKKATPADLMALRNKVDAAILDSDMWESVSVPAGTYQAGVHIPTGKWSVRAGDDGWPRMIVGDKIESNGKAVDYMDSDSWFNFELSKDNDVDILQHTVEIFELPDEYYVEISSGNVIFEPYSGQPNFWFYAKELPDVEATNDYDIENYTLSELADLKNQLNFAIWNSYSWDRVLVPSGIYTVGENIPVGDWKVEPPSESKIMLKYGSSLAESQMNMDVSYDGWAGLLATEDSIYFSLSNGPSTTIKIENGYYICLNNGIYAWFSPNVETISLGFKAFGGPTTSDESADNASMNDMYLFEIT